MKKILLCITLSIMNTIPLFCALPAAEQRQDQLLIETPCCQKCTAGCVVVTCCVVPLLCLGSGFFKLDRPVCAGVCYAMATTTLMGTSAIIKAIIEEDKIQSKSVKLKTLNGKMRRD